MEINYQFFQVLLKYWLIIIIKLELKYGNKSESFTFKDDLNEFKKINVKDIQLINRIELTYYYDQKTIKNFYKNPILCNYLIDLNKLNNYSTYLS